MRYVSIDIETTGLDPEKHQILEVAAVVCDTEGFNEGIKSVDDLPSFHCYLNYANYYFNKEVIVMHSELLQDMVKDKAKCYSPTTIMPKLHDFITRNGYSRTTAVQFVAAGKNFAGFDWPFLRKLTDNWVLKPHHRTLDPAMFFLKPDDRVPPSMKECMERAGIKGEVPHRALDDAKMVIRLIDIGMHLGQFYNAVRSDPE